jgi:Protein of unknown function (DUF1553)
LLGWLTADFAESGYDIRRLLRSLALSEAYQLASVQAADDPATFAWYLERPLIAEQLARSVQLVAQGSFQNDQQLVKGFRQHLKEVLPDETVVTVNDTLFYSNGAVIEEYLASSNSEEHLIKQLIALESHEQRVQRLFLAAFGREPAEDETAAVAAFLEKRADSMEPALRQVIWSLVTSAEFQFNH